MIVQLTVNGMAVLRQLFSIKKERLDEDIMTLGIIFAVSFVLAYVALRYRASRNTRGGNRSLLSRIFTTARDSNEDLAALVCRFSPP